ncbi:MAG: ferrous iron transport protein A [Lentisphaeraceae bacterium]|nr:ferrous iron transport protein A [Lentisphaeraceae bacterium]
MNLNELQIGQEATVKEISSHDSTLKRELEELGFVPGTNVKLISKGVFGTPRAFMLRGTTFALRKHEYEAISV